MGHFGDPSITCTLVMEEFGLQEVDAVLNVEVGPLCIQEDLIKCMVIGHLLQQSDTLLPMVTQTRSPRYLANHFCK